MSAEAAVDTESGLRLRNARHQRGLTQAQAAVEVGTSPQTWARWEAGQRPQMRFRGAIDQFLDQRGALRLIRDTAPTQEHHGLTALQERAIESYLARVATPPVSPDELHGFRAVFRQLGIEWES